jgi:hypothetical protein
MPMDTLRVYGLSINNITVEHASRVIEILVLFVAVLGITSGWCIIAPQQNRKRVENPEIETETEIEPSRA